MLSGNELIEAFDEHHRPPALAKTGISELDELTAGLQAGHAWVLTGGVGEGKTTLLTQFALAVASQNRPVQLATPREPAAWTTRRLLSMLGHIPVDFRTLPSRDRTTDPVRRARRTLAGLPLTLFASETGVFTPENDPYPPATTAAVLVDDADTVGGMTPARAAEYAAQGWLVVVALPREQVLDGPGDRAPLDPGWGRVSDVVLEVRSRCIGEVRDPESGERRPPELRPGEGELTVHRHRWGPTRTIHVQAHHHYATFTDLQR